MYIRINIPKTVLIFLKIWCNSVIFCQRGHFFYSPCIDEALSLNNPKITDYIDDIYPNELEIKDTTDAPKWANYLDLHLEFDGDGKLFTGSVRDYFDFPTVNVPCLSSNIPESPAYGVFFDETITT